MGGCLGGPLNYKVTGLGVWGFGDWGLGTGLVNMYFFNKHTFLVQYCKSMKSNKEIIKRERNSKNKTKKI